MKILFLLLILLVVSACVPTKSVNPKASKGNINSNAPYEWASSAFPRVLKISNDFSDAEVGNIQAMSSAWETAVENKMDLFENTEKTGEVSKSNLNLDSLGDDSVNGIYKITNWPLELNSMALAVTQIFGLRHNTGASDVHVRIEHADILINENLFNFRTGNAGVSGSYDLRTVVLHEMGHYLGLEHRYGDSVMVPSIGSDTANRAPKSIDALNLASKYKVTLSSGSSSAMITNSSPDYVPRDSGQKIKIMIELMANGECQHKENGILLRRHFVNLK